MSNFKMVLLTAAMIGGVVLGVNWGGKSFFKQMVGGGPFPSSGQSSAGHKALIAPQVIPPEHEDWVRRANAPQGQASSVTDKEDLGFAGDTPGAE